MPDFEFIIISGKCPGSNSPDVCIALFYRPPSSLVIPFWIPFLLYTLCRNFISLPSQVILMGDFNMNLTISPLYLKLLSIVYNKLYHPSISVKS